MIEKPIVGQRVWCVARPLHRRGDVSHVLAAVVFIECDDGHPMASLRGDLYATASEAGDALIAEGRRLIEAGEKLKQDTSK